MNFDFSEEQKALKDEARKFLAAKCPPDTVRKLMEDGSAGHRPWSLGAGSRAGLAGCRDPRRTWRAWAWLSGTVLHRRGTGPRGCAHPLCLDRLFLCRGVAARRRCDAQKAEYLPEIVAGEFIGTMASSEQRWPGFGGQDWRRGIGWQAERRKAAGHRRLRCDHAVVLAKEGGKPTLFLVDLNGAGVTREPLETLDRSRDAARIEFKDAPAERLGAVGDGLALFEAINDRAAVLLAFEQVGGSDMCLEMAKAYALERFAFGRQIGGYQAIKHRLADMYTKNVLARGNAYYGAWALNSDAPELPIAAAGARISASDAYWFASKENIQIHGGMGYTWEVDCHLHYRRSRQLSLVAGSAAQSGNTGWSICSNAATPPEEKAHGFQRHSRRSRHIAQTCAHGWRKTPRAA